MTHAERDWVAIVPTAKSVYMSGWRGTADWIRESSEGGELLLALANGIKVLMTSGGKEAPRLWFEMWAGEPNASNGVALVTNGETPSAWAQIPLCSCGERGCGNANRQFSESLTPSDAASLLSLAEALPYAGKLKDGMPTWHAH